MRFSALFPWLLALLSGVAMSCTFPPYDRAALAWIPFVAFAPLAWTLFFSPLPVSWRKRLGYTFSLGFVAGVTFFLLTLEWVTVVAWEGLVTLPFYLASYAGCWGGFVGMVLRPLVEGRKNTAVKNLFVALMAAAAWTGLEWLRGILFTGFGWNSFGVAFHHSLPFIQIADITGIGGLSFLGVMTGCMTALAIKRFVDEVQQKARMPLLRMRPHGDVLVTLLLLVTVMSYGMRELLMPAPSQKTLSIAAIQGNIPQNHKWNRAFEESIMETYCHESRIAQRLHPDLIVWPEAATPRPVLCDQKIFSQVEALVHEGDADFLIGSLHYEEQPQRDYNAAVLLHAKTDHDLSTVQYYAKSHLLPFGEYIPCRDWFPVFKWIIGDRILGDFNAGPGPKLLLLSHHDIKIAPLLCFEDTLGDLVRQFALLGAHAFVTLTNDGWFGDSAAAQQHVTNALFRCAETKLPMLRVANTGVTCLIDRFGRITHCLQDAQGKTFFEGMLAAQWSLPEQPSMTFYARHGDLFAQACLGIMFICVFSLMVTRRSK